MSNALTEKSWSPYVGGVLFGVGMTLLGYCPGTSVAAWQRPMRAGK